MRISMAWSLAILSTAILWAGGCRTAPPNQEAPANLEVIDRLEQIVSLRERGHARLVAQRDAGRAGPDDMAQVEIGVLQARMQLADARGDRGELIECAERVVELRKALLERAKISLAALSDQEWINLNIDVLQAEIDLINARDAR